MIESIHAQLSVWGRWAKNPIRHAVGYPSHAAGFGDYLPHGVEYKSSPPAGVFTGGAAMDHVDKAVQSLPASDRVICVEYYQIGPNWELVCARMKLSKSVLYRKLHRIHQALDYRMRVGLDTAGIMCII